MVQNLNLFCTTNRDLREFVPQVFNDDDFAIFVSKSLEFVPQKEFDFKVHHKKTGISIGFSQEMIGMIWQTF